MTLSIEGANMFVAVCRVDLHIAMATSLKDKRAVVQSVATRVRAKFPIAIAEVGALASRDLAVLGLAAISNEASHARRVLEEAARYVERLRMDADVGAIEFDVIPAFS